MNKTKFCPRCEKELLVVNFEKNRSTKSGLGTYCRKCKAECNHNWYLNGGKEKKRISEAAYRKKNGYNNYSTKLQKIARIKTWNAIRYGKIEKMPCKFCGERKVEAHHTDYSKPLDITWLCNKHHRKQHHKPIAVERLGK